MEIDKWLIDEVAWTLRHFYQQFKDCESVCDNKTDAIYNKAAHAALITAKNKFGMCMPIEDFIENVSDGYLIDYDGSGYFVNDNGDKIKSLRCNYDWLIKNIPEDCHFVMWYNK